MNGQTFTEKSLQSRKKPHVRTLAVSHQAFRFVPPVVESRSSCVALLYTVWLSAYMFAAGRARGSPTCFGGKHAGHLLVVLLCSVTCCLHVLQQAMQGAAQVALKKSMLIICAKNFFPVLTAELRGLIFGFLLCIPRSSWPTGHRSFLTYSSSSLPLEYGASAAVSSPSTAVFGCLFHRPARHVAGLWLIRFMLSPALFLLNCQ